MAKSALERDIMFVILKSFEQVTINQQNRLEVEVFQCKVDLFLETFSQIVQNKIEE